MHPLASAEVIGEKYFYGGHTVVDAPPARRPPPVGNDFDQITKGIPIEHGTSDNAVAKLC
jgi:hypothetical protein